MGPSLTADKAKNIDGTLYNDWLVVKRKKPI